MKTIEEQAVDFLEATNYLGRDKTHKELVKLLKRVQMDQRYACSGAAAMVLENPDPVCDAIMTAQPYNRSI